MKNTMQNVHKSLGLLVVALGLQAMPLSAQETLNPTVEAIIKEANTNSQLKRLGHELMDGVGPRLVGSSKMVQASDWAIAQYKNWGIEAKEKTTVHGEVGIEALPILIWLRHGPNH